MNATAKPLTKQAVKETAEELLVKNKTITSLEVKKALRLKGYFATQEEISSLLTMLCDEEGWTFTAQGGHKIYWK
jgi:hypothetical protein